MRWAPGLTLTLAMALAIPSVRAQTQPAPESPPAESSLPSAGTLAPPPPEQARYISDGKWTYPGTDKAAAFYPQAALEEGKSGKATIDCELDAEGYVIACKIVSETPKGYQFGYMTASLFINFARVDPATVTGGLHDGDRMKFVYIWSL